MDFFKFFDWPRKVELGNASQGNIAWVPYSGQVVAFGSGDGVVTLLTDASLICSGRPVRIDYSSIANNIHSGIVYVQQANSGVADTLFDILVRCNGVNVYIGRHYDASGNMGAGASRGVQLSPFSFIHLTPPKGYCYYEFFIISVSRNRYEVGATQITVMEL